MPKRKRAAAAVKVEETKTKQAKRRKIATKEELPQCERCGLDPTYSCIPCFRRVFGDPRLEGKINFTLDGEDLGWVERSAVHRLLDNWGINKATYRTLAIALGLVADDAELAAQPRGGCIHDIKQIGDRCGDCCEKHILSMPASVVAGSDIAYPVAGTVDHKVSSLTFLGWRYLMRVKRQTNVTYDDFARDMQATGHAVEYVDEQ